MTDKKMIVKTIVILGVIGIGTYFYVENHVEAEKAEMPTTTILQEGKVQAVVFGREPGPGFKEGLESAGTFYTLYDEGKALFKEGKFQEALIPLEKAYNVADNRSYQAMSLQYMAESYEGLEDWGIAANFWEAHAKTTMNSEKAAENRARAAELRNKANGLGNG